MKKIKILFVAFWLLFFFSCEKKKQSDAAVQYYTCSMDPQVREPKAGRCPICHMELTPVYHRDHTKDEVKLSEQQRVLGNIHADIIRPTSLVFSRTVAASVRFNPSETTILSSRANGKILTLRKKTIGEKIKKGEPLYALYSEEIQAALDEYRWLKKDSVTKKMAASLQQKFLWWGISPDKINNTRDSLLWYNSPCDGYVQEILVEENAEVKQGQEILKINSMNTFVVEGEPLALSANVSVGQLVQLYFPPNTQRFSKKIESIYPEKNTSTNAFIIRTTIPYHAQLKPGMMAYMELHATPTKGWLLPSAAVIQEQKQNWVWIEKEENTFHRHAVSIGRMNGNVIEVFDLPPNARVVTKGAYLLNSEYILQEAGE